MVAPVRRRRRQVLFGAALVCVAGLLSAVGAADAGGGQAEPSVAAARATGAQAEAHARKARSGAADPLEGFDPLSHERQGDLLVSPLPGGRQAELTLDPELQSHLAAKMEQYEVPFGAVVAMEPRTGRIRAYVSHSSANPRAGDLCRDATPPAASVFKVITGAALVDHGVSPDTRVCYGGGFRKLTAADLVDDSDRDRHCETLTTAMGYSINAIFAKLATRHLDTPTLRRYAEAFGFGHALPFDAPTAASPMEVPSDRLERARTAAGFWHMHMSPLHGALIAATVANDGTMPRAAMVERVTDASGRELHRHEPESFRAVIPRATARAVGAMMTRTVSHGTAKKWFFDPAGKPFLPGVKVAGKTGTLTGTDPHRAYTWWVGFAPAEDPELAVAALVVNTPRWRIKGSYMAREALRFALRNPR